RALRDGVPSDVVRPQENHRPVGHQAAAVDADVPVEPCRAIDLQDIGRLSDKIGADLQGAVRRLGEVAGDVRACRAERLAYQEIATVEDVPADAAGLEQRARVVYCAQLGAGTPQVQVAGEAAIVGDVGLLRAGVVDGRGRGQGRAGGDRDLIGLRRAVDPDTAARGGGGGDA